MKIVTKCIWLLILALFATVFAFPAAAFQPSIHMNISTEGLSTITVQLEDGRTITFTEEALDEIADANRDTDVGPGFFVGENHFTEEDFAASSGRLRNLKREIIDLITQSDPDEEAAQRSLGTALHTLQDFYAHSNWVERSNSNINDGLGMSLMPDPPLETATCPGNREELPANGGPILTSAYYSGLLGCGPIPAGKCVHGTPFLCDGINKDRPSQPFHFDARGLAVQASIDYVAQILADPAVANNDLAKKCLLGIASGTLGAVVDDTGSMGPEISQVKNQVAQIVDRVRETDEEPKQYLLMRFGDPDVGPVFQTSDADSFLSQVNALQPSGGGDCPELAFSGLFQAVSASRKDSNLFFFSDASSKDPELARAVSTAARLKRVRINFLLTGSCSPIDPSFLETAEQTGGLAFFLNSSELPATFDLVEPTLENDFVTILLARDFLTNDSRDYEIPVDTTVRRLVLSVAIDRGDLIEIRDPAGTPIAAEDPEVTIQQVSSGWFITVENPDPGVWDLNVTGDGDLSVAANANSTIEFLRFDFTELVNPVHRTYDPIDGLPVVGSSPTALAKLIGPYENVGFEIRSPSGNLVSDLSLSGNDEFAAEGEFAGPISPPTSPFRIAAVGTDSSGNVFRRLFPTVFQASTVAVEIDAMANPTVLHSGETASLEFTVTNHGTPDEFRLTARDDQDFIVGGSPSFVTLDTGESTTVDVELSVPADVSEGTSVLVTLVADSVNDPDTTNSAALELPVLTNLPPNCAAATDQHLSLWPPNHRLVAFDLATTSGVTDPDGDPVTFTITGITQDEPVDGPGSSGKAPDGRGIGDSVAEIRAERDGSGNGRVYFIGFTANDSQGGMCDGTLRISAPHSNNGNPAIDDGQAYDSTET